MRLYRAWLHLYPSSFRAEYGEELSAVFAAKRRHAHGPAGAISVWLTGFADVLVNATRAHLDLLTQDLRHTRRALMRAPGFALTAILVAALGIGATTAAFSIADHVLVRPLPFRDADRLVTFWQAQSFRGAPVLELSPPNYRDLAGASTSFETTAAITSVSSNLIGAGDPVRLDGTATTASLFDTLGVRAALGRVFTEADGRPGATPAVLLSDGLWRGQFGADPAVLGRTVTLSDQAYTIIGVMPRAFFFPTRETMFWLQTRFDRPADDDRTNTYLRGVARLKPGVSIAHAGAELSVIAERLERTYPRENAKTGAAVTSLRDQVGQQSRLLLLALVGASLCVLLITCTNLANLLLARALGRRHEIGVRSALGAGRERLARQMFTEAAVLAACGGALGVLLAIGVAPLVVRLVPTTLPVGATPSIDLRMLALAAFVTLGTSLGFGVLPALRASRSDAAKALRDGVRAGASRHTERVRSLLVIGEVVASVVLLVGAGLLLRAMWRVQDVDPGFRAAGVLTMRTQLPLPKYEETARRMQFYRRVLADVSALPGVQSAAYTTGLPMVMRGGVWTITPDSASEDPLTTRTASVRFVTPGFFTTAGIPRRSGRDVAETDTREAAWVAVVSESFARTIWPNERQPLGKRFFVAFRERTIVGVVGDVRVRGLERVSEPQVYLPAAQVPDGGLPFYAPKDLLVKASAAATLGPAIREIVARADPQQPVSSVRLLEDIVGAETTPRAVQIRVLGAFAALAVVLAAVGIHGLLAFSVSERGREIAVRMALGAQRADILRLVGRRAMVLGVSGALIGAACAWPAGRALQALLAGVDPADAITFATATGVAFAMVVAGSLLPVRRALRVNPVTAMRTE